MLNDPLDFPGSDRFELRRELGRGALGVVYEAWDRQQRRLVALKTLVNLDPAALERVRAEFPKLAAAPSPSLIGWGELFTEREPWFFTQELVDAQDFISFVRASGPLMPDGERTFVGPKSLPFDEARLRYALSELALAVDTLHRAEVLHLDLKPSNARFAEGGQLVLFDHGLLRHALLGESLSGPRLAETPYYMAPEWSVPGGLGPASDWYSVGVLLYEALTGRPPFTGPALEVMLAKRRDPAPSAALRSPGLPADLVALCSALLQIEPMARPSGSDVVARTVYDGGDGAAFGATLGTPRPGAAPLLPTPPPVPVPVAPVPMAELNSPTLRTPAPQGLGAISGLWSTGHTERRDLGRERTLNIGEAQAPAQAVLPAAEFEGNDRFVVQRLLGQGGMGTVYEVLDRDRGTHVALKTLTYLDPQSLLFFKNEFRALADLEHPNLVSLGELIGQDGRWFFTMELVKGRDLLAWVREGGPGRPAGETPEVRLRDALQQLSEALVSLHAAGMVHRDIKPSNVLVSEEGRVVLLDFGLVTEASSARPAQSEFLVGTPFYMAPEQAALQPVGAPADWYSVGVMLYQALTDRAPFEGNLLEVMLQKQQREPEPPRAVVPGVPPDLDALCVELMRMNPAARPSGPDVLARLTGASGAAAAVRPLRSSSAFSSTFVGREGEQRALAGTYEQRRSDRPTLFLVSGESGIGKSALARRFLASLQLAAPGQLVLYGRCYEREWVPYKALDEIIDALSARLLSLDAEALRALLPPDAELIGPLFPVFQQVPTRAGIVPGPAARLDALQQRGRAFVALRELFLRLADRFGVVLLIDDLQWADPDSLALLRELLHSPGAPSLFLLATVRTPAGGDADAIPPVKALTGVVTDVQYLALDPLPATDARKLVDQLSSGAEPRVVDAIVQESRGHPLFIHELVRQVGSGNTTVTRLDEALGARIDGLSPEARRLLELVAVAGAPLPQALIYEAAGVAQADTAGWLSKLRSARLVRMEGLRRADAVEPFHDRVRDAVLTRISPEQRRAHHLRLAEVLERDGTSARLRMLVTHLEGAGEIARAAACAERAAREAMAALAFDQAAELTRAALRLGDHPPDRFRALQLGLGDALTNAGRGAEAANVFLEAAEGADEATGMECRRKAAELQLASGHVLEGLQTLRAVLAVVGAELPTTTQGSLRSLRAHRAQLRRRGYAWTPREPGEIPPRLLQRIDVFNGIVIGLGAVDNVQAFAVQARALRLALEAGEQRRVARGLSFEGLALSQEGTAQEAPSTELAAKAREIVDRIGDPFLAGLTSSFEAMSHYYLGRFLEAGEGLARAEQLIREKTVGTSKLLSTTRLMQLQNMRLLGSFREMERLTHESVRDAVRRGDLYAEVSLTRVAGFLPLLRGDTEEALRQVQRRTWVPPPGRFHLQNWYELRTRAEVSLYEGRSDGQAQLGSTFSALERSEQLLIQIVRVEARWLWGRLALAAAEAGGEDRSARIAEAGRAARALLAEGVGYAAVWAHLLEAAICSQRGRPEQAIAALRQAVAGSDGVLKLHAAVAQRRLGELQGGEGGAAQIATADEWMREQGIRDPARLAASIAPGIRSTMSP